RDQIERVVDFADRIQIDLMDGVFAPNKNINPIQLWWPDSVVSDIHFMYQKPAEHLATLISLRPHMIILHHESEDDLLSMLSDIKIIYPKTIDRLVKLISLQPHMIILRHES